MKISKLKSTVTIIFALTFVVFMQAQNMCEKLITPQIEKIETSLEALKSNTGAEDFSKQMEKINSSINSTEAKIKSCEMKGRMSLDNLKARLKKSKTAYTLLNGDTPAVEQNQEIDFKSKSRFILMMQQCVDRHGLKRLKEEEKVLKRSEIEVLENYKDDGSLYYKTNIMIGQNYLENLRNNVNQDSWVKNAKITIDDKAKSINEDLKKKYMTSFYNDLVYIKEVALPNNTNLLTIINYLKKHL